MRYRWLIVPALLVLLVGCSSPAPAPAETAVPVQTIINIGSDTLVNLALAWAEAYMQEHPEVRISVTGGGSGTGIAALINGTAHIANASRAMKPEEIEAARANGINPVEFTVALDAIAVVVHPSNLVDHLTLQQISDIYTGKITNWKEKRSAAKTGPLSSSPGSPTPGPTSIFWNTSSGWGTRRATCSFPRTRC